MSSELATLFKLAAVEVAEPGTVPMADEQYTAAVHALAVLINDWRTSQAADGTGAADGPLAA